MPSQKSLNKEIVEWLEESAAVKKSIAENGVEEIESAVKQIIAVYKNGGKLVVFGNGGSAADAQHIAAEFVGRFFLERQALPAIALTTNTSILTAIANDYGYDAIFARQVEAFVTAKDIAIGISTSGNSASVIGAIKAAKKKRAKTIALTGGNGGKLAKEADLTINVPSKSTPHIQEAHITIGHVICMLVEKALFAPE